MLLSNEDFLNQLTLLYQSCRKSRSVNLTVKRYDGRTKPKSRPNKSGKQVGKKSETGTVEPQCLFRASDGHKKLSTCVLASDLNTFQPKMQKVLKSNLDGLKKHNKKRNKQTTNME